MQDSFKFIDALEQWKKDNKGDHTALAKDIYKESYSGSSKFANQNLRAGMFYATTRILLPEEEGIMNVKPIYLSLGPKLVEGPRREVVIDFTSIPTDIRPKILSEMYIAYKKKLHAIAEETEDGGKQKTFMQFSSKEAVVIFRGLVPVSSIVSVPRESLTKIHTISLTDWPMLCFIDTGGFGTRLKEVIKEFKQALGKRN